MAGKTHQNLMAETPQSRHQLQYIGAGSINGMSDFRPNEPHFNTAEKDKVGKNKGWWTRYGLFGRERCLSLIIIFRGSFRDFLLRRNNWLINGFISKKTQTVT
ncbi:MAG: hypothetical protein U1F55_08310 [Chitinivorax sp.]